MQKSEPKVREVKRKRKITKDRKAISTRGSKTIRLPETEENYRKVIDNPKDYRKWLDSQYKRHPQLFPLGMESGYLLHDILKSKKQKEVFRRRIELKATGSCYTVSPSFVMPYMVGKTQEVEKALYLRKYGVPFDALTYVFGRNDVYWERMELSLSRFNIVGTTIQTTCELPADIASDENHTKQLGERTYACLTTCRDCVLGAAISPKADTEGLTQAYQEFKEDIYRGQLKKDR